MANKIIHKRSSVVTDGVAKLPKSSELEYGELAINFGSGAETISLKNSNDEIVEFKSNNYYEAVIKENEFITATALTDLDDRTTALEKIIQSDDFITKEDLDNKVDNDVFTTYTGSTATNTEDLTNRLATLEEVVEDNEFVTAGSLSDLNKRIANVDEKVENCVSNDSFKEFTDAYEEDERAVAATFTTLEGKITEVKETFNTYVDTTAPNTFATKEEVESVFNLIDEDGLVVATALADLDNRMICVEGADKGKSIRQIANEELIQQLIPADAQASLDTLQEIAAWIQEHPEDAAAMNEAIASKVGNEAFNAYTGTTAPNAFAPKEHTHEQYTTNTAFEEFKEEVNKDARVIATALTTLDTRMNEADSVVGNKVDNETFEAFADAYEEDELVIAAAFTTLDKKVAEVEDIFDTYTGTTAPNTFAPKEHTHEQYTTNTTFEEFKEEVNKDARVIATALTTLDTRMNEEFITNAEFEEFQTIIDKDNLVVATSLTDLNNRMAKVENGNTSYELAITAITEGLTGTLSSEEMNKLLASDTVIVNYANYKLTPITKAEAEGILSYSYALDTLIFRMIFGGTTYAIINVSDNKPISKYVWELSDISDGASGQIPSTEVTKMFNASEIIISNGIISYSILAKAVSDAYNVLTFFESMSTFKIVNIAVLPDGTYEIAHNSLN